MHHKGPGVLLFYELMSAVGAGYFQPTLICWGAKIFAALRTRSNLVFQGLLNLCLIKTHNVLSVYFKGRNSHDFLGGQNFSGIGILCDVTRDVRDMLF